MVGRASGADGREHARAWTEASMTDTPRRDIRGAAETPSDASRSVRLGVPVGRAGGVTVTGTVTGNYVFVASADESRSRGIWIWGETSGGWRLAGGV